MGYRELLSRVKIIEGKALPGGIVYQLNQSDIWCRENGYKYNLEGELLPEIRDNDLLIVWPNRWEQPSEFDWKPNTLNGESIWVGFVGDGVDGGCYKIGDGSRDMSPEEIEQYKAEYAEAWEAEEKRRHAVMAEIMSSRPQEAA